MINFYYTDESGNVAGPVTREQLQKLVDAGSTPENCQACYEGSEEWKPLSTYIHATPKPKAAVRAVTTNKANPTAKIPRVSSTIRITVTGGAVALLLVVGFQLWQHGFFGPRISIPEIYKTQLMRSLEECSKVSAMTSQGVSYRDFTQQVANARSAYDLTKSTWPPNFSPASGDEFDEAFHGWFLAVQVWRAKVEDDDEPTEPDTNHYADISAYAGSYITQRTHENGRNRGLSYFPFDSSISALFTVAGQHYEKAKRQVLTDIQAR
jgi:hypothetical protein